MLDLAAPMLDKARAEWERAREIGEILCTASTWTELAHARLLRINTTPEPRAAL